MKKRWLPGLVVLLVLLTGISVKTMHMVVSRANAENGRWLVVIDPGHGGFDPGKVGVDGTLEKDLNLAVSLKLRDLLEQNDVQVILTREADSGLAEGGRANKSEDMRNRVARVNEAGADLAVSIHQNSYTDSRSIGAQVFYYGESQEGKRLAELLQLQLKETLQDGNHRQEKANSEYYMLKKTLCPFAIVECGFLSNPEEAARLKSEEWQSDLAWALHLGILQYLNQKE